MNNLTNYFLQRQFYLFQDIPKIDLNNFSLLTQQGGKDNKKRWTKMSHNGPMFPLSYEPHKIPVIIKNKEIILPMQAEEYATMYAKYVDTPYTENNTFNKNFWKDFEPTLKELNFGYPFNNGNKPLLDAFSSLINLEILIFGNNFINGFR